MKSPKTAYVFPLILLAALAVGIFILTISRLQRSTRSQYIHLNEYQRAFNIAYSALVEILSETQKKQWNNRSFPVSYTRDLFNGQYNLLAQDHTEQYVFNVKIRVRYADKFYLFYWRLKYLPDLLDFTTFAIPVYFSQFPDLTGNMSDFDNTDAKVDEELAKRVLNKDNARQIARIVNAGTTLGDSLGALGITLPDILGADTVRSPAPPLSIDSGQVPSKDLAEIVENSQGVVTPKIKDVIKDYTFTDFYPEVSDTSEVDGIGEEEVLDIMAYPHTRLDTAVFFVRLLELPETDENLAVDSFSDIDAGSTDLQMAYNKALSSAFEHGIIKGYDDGTYRGDEVIVRRQMGTILGNTVAYIDSALPDISDPAKLDKYSRIKSWAEANIDDFKTNNSDDAVTLGDAMEIAAALQ